jgi:hypothetical protein
MVAFNKFFNFTEDLAKGIHQLHAAGHTLKIYLSNAVPSQSLDLIKGDLAEITPANGYPAGGTDVQNDVAETGGVCSVTGVDVTFTAAGGPFGPFQYAVLYNDTPTSPADPLIGWWDYGSPVTIADGDPFIIDFGTSLFTIT